VPLVVGVQGTQLVSPGWNQHRPWLTGSWVMSWPQELVAETGEDGPGAVTATHSVLCSSLSAAAFAGQAKRKRILLACCMGKWLTINAALPVA